MQYTQYPDRRTDRQPAASWQANWADRGKKVVEDPGGPGEDRGGPRNPFKINK